MKTRLMLAAMIATGLVVTPAAFAQDGMTKTEMSKDKMEKKMDKKKKMSKSSGKMMKSGGMMDKKDTMSKDDMKK